MAEKKVLTYRLTLHAPLVLSMPGGDVNCAETLPFLSGGSILGALAGRWLKNETCKTEPSEHPEFRALFLDGTVRYLHAYPEGEFESRLLPTPASLRVEKGQETPVYDLAIEDKEDLLYDDDDMPRIFKPWTPGFVRLTEAAAKYRSPVQTARIHHHRDRKAGRALGDETPIFSYISLEPGEQFIGHILIEREDLLSKVRMLLEQGPLMLGRSRSAQYGGWAKADGFMETSGKGFTEAGVSKKLSSGSVTVTLLSDYLGTDANGHYNGEAFFKDLSNKFGKVEVKDSIIRHGKTAGYVSVWRMPRPVRPALKAGTVFRFNLKNSVDKEKVETLLWEGLGDRRAEGFGRLAVNWHGAKREYTPGEDNALDEALAAGTAETEPVNDPVTLSLIALSQKRLIREGTELAIAEFCAGLGESRIPTKATLGRVRSRLRTAETGADICRFLTDVAAKKAGKDLKRCRLHNVNRSLFDWLKALFEDAGEIGRNLNLEDAVLKPYGLQNADAARRAFGEMREEFQKRLADMALQKLTRLKKEEENG